MALTQNDVDKGLNQRGYVGESIKNELYKHKKTCKIERRSAKKLE